MKKKKKISKINRNNKNQNKILDLNYKVDEFINWYYINMVKGKYDKFMEKEMLKRMRNLIEKMAVWYEFRYPNCIVNESSYYTYNNLPEFMLFLSDEEKEFFRKPQYKETIYFHKNYDFVNLKLNSKGYVIESTNVSMFTGSIIKDDELIGLHLKDVVDLFPKRNIFLPEKNELEENLKTMMNWKNQKNGMLNSVMYRIIERGGEVIGPKRALLFAREYKKNINIPMMYGISFDDPNLKEFINDYLNIGGDRDLKCYLGYFKRKNNRIKLDTIKLYEVLNKLENENSKKLVYNQK